MLTGSNLVQTKQYNLRLVHETIRLLGPVSRAEIARRTALTGQTVSNLVRELLSVGLVHETERMQEGRGAPSTALVINPDGAYAIGLDLNRDHLTGVLVDIAGRVRQRVHRTAEAPSPDDALDMIAEVTETLVERQQLSRDRVWGVGIGVPGPMRHGHGADRYLVSPDALPGWQDVPLASLARERLALPVFLENNAAAAAAGERWYGTGRQIETFFYLFFGTGLGGGLVINGRPHLGASGNAAEIAYLPATLADAGLAGGPSHIGACFDLPRLYETLRRDGTAAHTPRELGRLLVKGHPALLDWMDTAADHLTGLVLVVEYLLDPEAIFYGGRLPDNMLIGLMERVARRLPERRTASKAAAPRHLLATAGADAAALGVATLPISESFAPALRVLLKRRGARAGAPAGLSARAGVAR